MIDSHLLKLRKRDAISAAEEAALRRMVKDVRRVPAGDTVIRAGEQLSESLLVLDGWLGRAKHLGDGQRQITQLHVPGDFADLHGFPLGHLDHDLITLSAARLAAVPHTAIKAITEAFPRLGRLFWFTTEVDAAILREWALSLGRRSALGRMAHLFCEMFVRLEIVGLTVGDGYQFPLTQEELASCLGLTSVHINRTLQELRRLEVIRVEQREATILDHARLKELADFDPAYLYLERRSF